MILCSDVTCDTMSTNLKEPAVKDFVARKAHTIKSSKVQGTHWNMINCKEHLGNHPETVIGQATITLIHQFRNPYRIPCLSCTALT